jgi:hypothetical protein
LAAVTVILFSIVVLAALEDGAHMTASAAKIKY